LEFELKETAVEVCERFVSANWRGELAVMVGKIWVYERTPEILQLRSVCNDIFGRYVK
jgi:hypothetical protein